MESLKQKFAEQVHSNNGPGQVTQPVFRPRSSSSHKVSKVPDSGSFYSSSKFKLFIFLAVIIVVAIVVYFFYFRKKNNVTHYTHQPLPGVPIPASATLPPQPPVFQPPPFPTVPPPVGYQQGTRSQPQHFPSQQLTHQNPFPQPEAPPAPSPYPEHYSQVDDRDAMQPMPPPNNPIQGAPQTKQPQTIEVVGEPDEDFTPL